MPKRRKKSRKNSGETRGHSLASHEAKPSGNAFSIMPPSFEGFFDIPRGWPLASRIFRFSFRLSADDSSSFRFSFRLSTAESAGRNLPVDRRSFLWQAGNHPATTTTPDLWPHKTFFRLFSLLGVRLTLDGNVPCYISSQT